MNVKYATVMSSQFHALMPRILARLYESVLPAVYAAVLLLFVDVLESFRPDKASAFAFMRQMLADPSQSKSFQFVTMAQVITREWTRMATARAADVLAMHRSIEADSTREVAYATVHNICGVDSRLRMAVELAGGVVEGYDDAACAVMVVVPGHEVEALGQWDGPMMRNDEMAPPAVAFLRNFSQHWTVIRGYSPAHCCALSSAKLMPLLQIRVATE